MNIYTRRNAAVGYLTLKAMQRAVDEEAPPAPERAARSPRTSASDSSRPGSSPPSSPSRSGAGRATRTRALGFESDTEIVGEYVTAPEPVPAT